MAGNGHDKLQVFGLLKDSGEASIRSWIDQLIVQDFLEVTEDGEYPLLRITEAGRGLCNGRGSVLLGMPVPPKVKGKKKSKALKRAASGFLPADEELFEKLRALRRGIADKAGIPPYIIFHDSVLIEMAASKPQTLEDLSGIKGIGDKKLEKYGRLFLDIISGRP